MLLFGQPMSDTDSEIVERLERFGQWLNDLNLAYNPDQVDNIPSFFADICAQAARLVLAVDRSGYEGEDVLPIMRNLRNSRMASSALRSSSPLWQMYCSATPPELDFADLYDFDDSDSSSWLREAFASALGVDADDIVMANAHLHKLIMEDETQQYDIADDGPKKWVVHGSISFLSVDEKLSAIDYLLDRVALEQAAMEGDYVGALEHLAKTLPFSMKPTRAPWLLDGFDERVKQWCDVLKRQPGGVDWTQVVQRCETIGEYCDGDFSIYVHRLAGWAEAQLTPSELHNLNDNRENVRSVSRLRRYFFPGRLWGKLPEEAQNALIVADRTWMSENRDSMLLTILNPLQRATERVLYDFLWIPLMKYADNREIPADVSSGILTIRKNLGTHAPGLTHYWQVVWTKMARSYFHDLGIMDKSDDMRYLTDENRMPKHLQTLLDARGRAEYPGSSVKPAEVRSLYSEFLGIGRKGVLPELLHLLVRRMAARGEERPQRL